MINQDSPIKPLGDMSGHRIGETWSERLSLQPAYLICLVVIVFSAVYFVRHSIGFYNALDFASGDLGNSDLTDFFVFYSSARFLWDGGAAGSLYDSALLKSFQLTLGAGQAGIHSFNYPPTYLFLIWPLGGLSYATALIVHQLLTLAFFAHALRMAGLRSFEVLAATAAPATVLNFSAGQNGCFTSALLIGGLALLARRQIASGVLIGLLTVKPHIGLLVPVVYLAERRWWAIAAATCVTFALIGASILAFGSSSWGAYLEFLTNFQAQIQAQSGGNFLKYSATVHMAGQIMGLPKGLAYGGQVAISLGVSLAVYRAYRQSQDETLRLVLLLVGISLAMPFGFLYDLPFMAAAVILVVRIGLRSGFLPFEQLCLSAIWFMPYLSNTAMEWGVPLAPWSHLIFFCFVLARIRQTTDRA